VLPKKKNCAANSFGRGFSVGGGVLVIGAIFPHAGTAWRLLKGCLVTPLFYVLVVWLRWLLLRSLIRQTGRKVFTVLCQLVLLPPGARPPTRMVVLTGEWSFGRAAPVSRICVRTGWRQDSWGAGTGCIFEVYFGTVLHSRTI